MRLSVFLSVLGCCFALSGCGRVSPPALPEGAFYPHTYIVTETKEPEEQNNSSANTIAAQSDSPSEAAAFSNEPEDIFTLEDAQKSAADFAESVYD